jgi:hypothetical protein
VTRADRRALSSLSAQMQVKRIGDGPTFEVNRNNDLFILRISVPGAMHFPIYKRVGLTREGQVLA